MTDLTVAHTIIEQMGGVGKLSAMIGAKNFAGTETSVMFAFKGCRKANKCRVTLLDSDFYRMELFKMQRGKVEYKTVYDEEGLYFDMLIPEFQKETGLDLFL